MTATRSAAASAAAVPIAFLLANALSYALLLAAAHRMTTADYGVLSSLLGLLLISTIPMLALQTVAARRAAARAGSAGLVRGAAAVGAIATGVLLAASPALSRFLHLHDLFGVALVAATVPAGAVLGTAQGIAQGRRRFGRLAWLILATTGGRSIGGLVGLFAGNTPDSTVVGVLIGTGLAAAAVVVRAPGTTLGRTAWAHRGAGVVVETLHAMHAHGIFLVLAGMDVLLARHVLTSSQAGGYAVGAIVTRATLWLPQSVVILLFAGLAEAHRQRSAARQAGAAVAALGAMCVLGCAVLGPLVVDVVGGSRYGGLDHVIWQFALLGALLAVLQLAVLAGLAQRNPWRAAVLWFAIALDVTAVLSTDAGHSPQRLVTTLCVSTAVAAAVALILLLRQVPVAAGHGPGVKLGSSPGPN